MSHCSGFPCWARALECSSFSSCDRGLVVAVPGLSSTRSMVVAHRHVGSSQIGTNSCFLHWQADFLPLSHQGSPKMKAFWTSFGRNLRWVSLPRNMEALTPWDILCSTVQQHPSPRTVQEHHHLTRRCPVPVGCLRALVLSRKWSFHFLLYQGFFKKILFACLFYFWLWLGLLCCVGLLSSHKPVVHGLLTELAFFVRSFRSTGSRVRGL